MSEQPEFEPPIFNTHHPRLRGHFEMYDGAEALENGEPEFDEVRKEIALYDLLTFSKLFNNVVLSRRPHHSDKNCCWRCLLDKIRTFFEQNPD
jgi:hypothetical protein